MTLLQPLFLVACLGALLPLASLRSGRLLPAALPAGWSRLIGPGMYTIAARHVIASRDVPGALVAAGLWLVIGIALAEPVLKSDSAGGAANLAGRVIVLDMSETAHVDQVRSAAADIALSLSDVPVAIVAATGDAFDVVPFTSDHQHVRRYLSVLTPDVMPIDGYEPQRAIAHAEAMLVRAGMIAGQTILVTGSTTARSAQLARDRWLRAIVYVRRDTVASPAVQAMADQADARLVTAGDHAGLDADLEQAISSLTHDSPELSGQTPLQPWLIGIACLLWLLQFRRAS